jgi:hypothetical protein
MADYVSSSRHKWPTYDGATDHTNPQRLQEKYSSSGLNTVTTGGPDEWQCGQVPNGGAVGFGPSADGIAHAETEKHGAVVGVLKSLADGLGWRSVTRSSAHPLNDIRAEMDTLTVRGGMRIRAKMPRIVALPVAVCQSEPFDQT